MLALNSSTIRDAALNDAILTHGQWSSNWAYIADTTPPTVSRVAITDENGIQNSFVNAGDDLEMTVTFNEVDPSAVIVTGTPTLTFVMGSTNIGSTNRTATYASGDNTTPSSVNDNASLVFDYEIKGTGTS